MRKARVRSRAKRPPHPLWLLLPALLLAFFILMRSARADVPSASTGLGLTSTSESLEQTRFALSGLTDRADITWPYPGERESGFAFGLGYERSTGNAVGALRPTYLIERPAFLVGAKFSPSFTLDADLGWSFVKTEPPARCESLPTGSLKSVFAASPEQILRFDFERSSMLQELMLPNDISNPLGFTTLRLASAYSWSEVWRATETVTHRWLDDGNRRLDADLSLMYAYSKFPLWLWFGFGAGYTGMSERSARYWSPLKVFSAGPRFDVAIPFTAFWQLKAGGSLHWLQEEDYGGAFGDYLRTSVVYGLRDAVNFELSFVDSRSTRDATTWWSRSFGAALNIPF